MNKGIMIGIGIAIIIGIGVLVGSQLNETQEVTPTETEVTPTETEVTPTETEERQGQQFTIGLTETIGVKEP